MTKSIFLKCFLAIIATVFLSCSSDEEEITIDFIELPSSDLGVYEGVLSSVDPSLEFQIREETFVTLSESGSRVYTIEFDDDISSVSDIPSFTDVQFFVADDSFPENSIQGESESGDLRMNLVDFGEQRVITITYVEGNNPSIGFTGQRLL